MLYYESVFLYFYFALMLLTYFFKAYSITYPPDTLGPEITALICFAVLLIYRINMGNVGNKGESMSSLVWFLLISVPGIIGCIFFMVLATYVMVSDLIINLVLIIFMSVELLLGIMHLLKLRKTQRAMGN